MADTVDRVVHVYRTGKTYGVFVQPGRDGSGQELLEGGFFSRSFAENCADEWAKSQSWRRAPRRA